VPDSPSLLATLVHELNQPLTAILSNAQAAQRFLESDPLDLKELREILSDIVADDKRAAGIVRSIGALLPDNSGDCKEQA
jgi:two-component system, LuxR family, sensor kinase FixL